jgi:hypothetical protein
LENHWLPLIERCYNGKVRILFYRYVEVEAEREVIYRMVLSCSLFLL